jgi:hypothetical protein
MISYMNIFYACYHTFLCIFGDVLSKSLELICISTQHPNHENGIRCNQLILDLRGIILGRYASGRALIVTRVSTHIINDENIKKLSDFVLELDLPKVLGNNKE